MSPLNSYAQASYIPVPSHFPALVGFTRWLQDKLVHVPDVNSKLVFQIRDTDTDPDPLIRPF